MKFFDGLELRQELDQHALDLSKNKKVIEFVKVMNPLDMISVFQNKLRLKPKQATYLYANILKNSLREWATSSSQSDKSQYPIPATNRSPVPTELDDGEFDMIGDIKTDDELKEDYVNTMPAYVANNWEFPFQGDEEGEGWPYDSNTTYMMDPHHKGKRALTTAFNPESDGSPSRVGNLEPGVSGQGTGIQVVNQQSSGNEPDMAGNLTTQGVEGWSSSPPGKEYDMPEGLDDGDMYNSQEEPEGGLLKNLATNMGFGGRVPDRNMGFRKK